jgi:hypothetical protein
MTKEKPAAGNGGHEDQIRISDFRPQTKNSLKGTFTLILPSGMVIHGCLLLETNGKRWVGTPAREWTDAQGKKQYARIIDFVDRETASEWQEAVLHALDLAGSAQ